MRNAQAGYALFCVVIIGLLLAVALSGDKAEFNRFANCALGNFCP